MNILDKLEPKEVWTCFEEITRIPRPSKKEEKIIDFLIKFGKSLKLETNKDNTGNVIIKKPATKGMEKKKSVVLQCHMDMVCEKNSEIKINFENDPIQPVIDGEWVKAKGTTLGADDGIGIAAAMALLKSQKVQHGPLECLFTVDEETGLTGAFGLKPGFFSSEILINLDSEDEGEIFIGCAGGVDTLASMKYSKSKIPLGHIAFKVSVSGLKGGHSGDDIHRELGNSNKILNRLLWEADKKFSIRLNNFDGGNLRNAIPRDATGVFTIDSKHKKVLIPFLNKLISGIKTELEDTAPDLNIFCKSTTLPAFVLDKKTQSALLSALYSCPHGVIRWSQKMKGMVETSTNLASVKFAEKNQILITTSQRSSVSSSKTDIANMVESVFVLAGAKVTHSEGYPGWNPNPDSKILKIAVASYEKLFKKKPVVRAIHAGLECGLFLEKYPNLDMISIGPTLRGVHSPAEKIEIKTVDLWWKHLLDILKNIPSN